MTNLDSLFQVIFIHCQDNLSWFKANTVSVLLQVWPPPSRSVLSGLISGPQRLCWERSLPAHCQSNCSQCSQIPGERWCEIQIWYVLLTKLQKSPCTHVGWALSAWSASLTCYKLQLGKWGRKKEILVGVRTDIMTSICLFWDYLHCEKTVHAFSVTFVICLSNITKNMSCTEYHLNVSISFCLFFTIVCLPDALLFSLSFALSA